MPENTPAPGTTRDYALYAHCKRAETANAGLSAAMERLVREFVGPKLIRFQDLERRYLGTIRVPADYDIRQLLNASMYAAIVPSIDTIEIRGAEGAPMYHSRFETQLLAQII